MPEGPYFRHLHWNVPSKYVLTKTHCGGHLISKSPNDYVETVRSFDAACRSGSKIVNDTKVHVEYSSSIPQRAVHLIRDPFDNIVARLHLEQKRWRRFTADNSTDRSDLLQRFNDSQAGFYAWCNEMDTKSRPLERSSRFIDNELWSVAKDVPCHGEFLRYVWWHNMAIHVIRNRKLPVHTMHYEDYETKWEDTVHHLFGFLELRPAAGAEPLEFITGKQYRHYFEARHISMARRLVQALASPETWHMLEHYFEL